MSTNYKWIITGMPTAPSENGLTDVVKKVDFIYQGIDGEYSAIATGSMDCAAPTKTDFTAYPDLTEDQVISWLEAGVFIDALKANVDAQIANKKNPPVVNLPLPWESQPVVE